MFHGSSQVLPVMRQNTPVSLVDSSKWIGAWDFNSEGNPNLVVFGSNLLGAMDSDVGKFPDRSNTIGVLQTYVSSGYNLSRVPSLVITGAFLSTATTGTTPSADKSLTSYTLGCWIKKIDVSKPVTTEDLNMDSSSALNVAGFGFNDMHVGALTVSATTNNPAGQFRHIVVENGSWKYYEDGVLISSGSDAANPLVFDRVYVRGTTQGNFDGANVSPAYFDNIIIIEEALSPTAIAALASGHMPSGSGVLV